MFQEEHINSTICWKHPANEGLYLCFLSFHIDPIYKRYVFLVIYQLQKKLHCFCNVFVVEFFLSSGQILHLKKVWMCCSSWLGPKLHSLGLLGNVLCQHIGMQSSLITQSTSVIKQSPTPSRGVQSRLSKLFLFKLHQPMTHNCKMQQ